VELLIGDLCCRTAALIAEDCDTKAEQIEMVMEISWKNSQFIERLDAMREVLLNVHDVCV
jgi:hypothetical protein